MHRRTIAVLIVLLLIVGGLLYVSRQQSATLTPTPGGLPSATQGGFQPGGPSTATSGSTRGLGGAVSGSNVMANPGGGLPVNAVKPVPPQNNYQGCPAVGDGGDPELNIRKNRTDSAPWYPVSVASILQLQWPKSVERIDRQRWSAADAAAVARYEGLPIQIEGWLAGAKQEGPESCNCHSADDVDNHLWLVDSPAKDRSQSVVVEITPRLRAEHPGWAFSRISPLVDGVTKVRISGWLLMDGEHPDQLGKTRGTIWEIHPIVAFDVRRNNDWIALDTGRVSTTATQTAGEVPTVDPNLPPAIVETPAPGSRPTATSRPPAPQSGGQATTLGAVGISDIFYNGVKGSNEPDEYVEITNTGTQAVNLESWTLRDVYGGQEFTWHAVSIQPGGRIRVYTNESHPESGGFSFHSGSAIWRNAGDAAELVDAGGTVVSTFAYGDRR
jgi:hypothetical protein